MNAIFKKLNYKAQSDIYVLHAPESFQSNVSEIRNSCKAHTTLDGASKIGFVLLFAIRQFEVDQFAQRVSSLLDSDAVVWIAYPKGTSKKYKCEFNRDNGWTAMGSEGFEPVRMIAIDEDWSALRFRRVENIKKMTRSSALTQEGKEKIAARKRSGKIS